MTTSPWPEDSAGTPTASQFIGAPSTNRKATPPLGNDPAALPEIDLAPALKVVGDNAERQRWLSEMLQQGGMAPGSSARAHARAFRFADALRRVGYRVTEAPSGPRGGRRFSLGGYDGSRAGEIFRLKENRSCSGTHSLAECDCFDGLSDHDLRLVKLLYRTLARTWGLRYDTDTLAHLVVRYDADVLADAVRIYVQNTSASGSSATLEELLEAVTAARL